MRVVIIGGGISGLSIAYHLAKRGVNDITVLEAKYIGYGSTGRCATGIRASFTSEEHIVLMRESIKMWKEFTEGELGKYGLEFEQKGYLWIARKESTLENFKTLTRIHNSYGIPTKILEPTDVCRIVPQLNVSKIVGAMIDPMAGKSYPFDTLHAFYMACRSKGVKIYTKTEALKLNTRGNRIQSVETNRGTVEGDIFVVAAGFGTRELLKTVGIPLPLKNMPRHVLVTEAFREAFGPLVIDYDTPGVPYIVQTKEGNFFIGREIEEEPELSIYSQRIDFMSKALRPIVDLFPFLRSLNVLRYWIGYYVTTPDNHPIYGPVEGFENLYIAAGFSGHGYMMGPITGRIIAEWILDGRPSIPQAERLTMERFRTGKLIQELAIIG